MRTSTIVAALALASCASSAPPQAPAAILAAEVEAPSGEYVLDPAHASLTIRASHFGLSNYTLRLTQLEATLVFSAEDPTASSLTAVARAASVETDFPAGDRFDVELRSPRWLDADAHPDITFRSSAIELTSPTTGRVHGEITLRGITRPLTLDVTLNRAYAQHPFGRPLSQLGFSARGMIRRSEFGMNVLQPTATEVGVSDEVELIIEAEFVRPIPS